MRKNKLLLLLALLMTAATGAWAQDAKHLITATYDKQTRSLEQPLPYATTIGELYEAITGESFSDLISSMSAVGMPLTGIGSNNTSVVSIGELNGASTPVTVNADGKATVGLNFSGYVRGSYVSVVPPLYVTMADDTKDADKWTASTDGTNFGALPIGGLKGDGSETVTLKYNGRLKVKGVTATIDAAPAEASVPDGAINGKFSVSDTKKVYFSKGNLQATYNTSWSWAFATNQWDYIGNAAGNTSINGVGTISGTGTVDLFGWVGAACAWTGAAQYGISNEKAAAQYGNVEGEALKSDWGTLAITNGGNTANFGWHSLASSEWEYLFKTRTTPSGVRYAHATVNSVPGLVLLPDDWSADYYSLNNVNDAYDTAYTDNDISSSDWTSKLEAHGAVFLPAGGNRGGATVNDAGNRGNYWSSTPGTTAQSACYFYFGSGRFMGLTQNSTRNRGCSVRLVREVATTDAEPAAQVDPLAVPMTIEAITAGAIKVSSPKEGMQYSLDGGKTKNAVTTDDIVLNVGDKVQFYGNGTSITSYDGTNITSSGDGFTCKVYGNIMSLVDETGFATATTLSANNTFYSLFFDFITLTDASGLLLPATQLAANCYRDMFYGCTALTAAPALPATQLANNCYQQMFKSCTALTAAPELPATQLSNNCYYRMFQGCASLTTAPALPATQLASSCYREMFSICARLTTAPVLPAETLVSNCYNQMFYNCSKLATVTCLATSGINQSGSTTRWLQSAGTQAEDTKTVYTISTADWPTMNNNGIPDGWQRVNVDN